MHSKSKSGIDLLFCFLIQIPFRKIWLALLWPICDYCVSIRRCSQTAGLHTNDDNVHKYTSLEFFFCLTFLFLIQLLLDRIKFFASQISLYKFWSSFFSTHSLSICFSNSLSLFLWRHHSDRISYICPIFRLHFRYIFITFCVQSHFFLIKMHKNGRSKEILEKWIKKICFHHSNFMRTVSSVFDWIQLDFDVILIWFYLDFPYRL